MIPQDPAAVCTSCNTSAELVDAFLAGAGADTEKLHGRCVIGCLYIEVRNTSQLTVSVRKAPGIAYDGSVDSHRSAPVCKYQQLQHHYLANSSQVRMVLIHSFQEAFPNLQLPCRYLKFYLRLVCTGCWFVASCCLDPVHHLQQAIAVSNFYTVFL